MNRQIIITKLDELVAAMIEKGLEHELGALLREVRATIVSELYSNYLSRLCGVQRSVYDDAIAAFKENELAQDEHVESCAEQRDAISLAIRALNESMISGANLSKDLAGIREGTFPVPLQGMWETSEPGGEPGGAPRPDYPAEPSN